MTRPMTREEAARTLGLPASSDIPAVKRAYRRLAREHHPDLGGDADTFHELQRAYERLAEDEAPPPPPTVARGRPSRPPVAFTDETRRADLSAITWETPLPESGLVRLDVDRVAVWLATNVDHAGTDARSDDAPVDTPLVRTLLATSRAPGSRLNRASHLLAAELTAQLRITDTIDDRGRAMVGVEVTAGSRRARRALDAVRLDGGWVRTRGSSWTRLRTMLPPSPDRRATAVRATERLAALLDDLDWPLHAWSLERPPPPQPA